MVKMCDDGGTKAQREISCSINKTQNNEEVTLVINFTVIYFLSIKHFFSQPYFGRVVARIRYLPVFVPVFPT